MLERISIELTNRCSKGCSFCYNNSHAAGATMWTVDEVATFVSDCTRNGVRAVSFGGGEPLEFDGIFDLLSTLDGVIFRSMTTNGLLLEGEMVKRLVAVRPDKVHISIHSPHSRSEVERVIRQVGTLGALGIRGGINLLVARSKIGSARAAAATIREAGIGTDQIVYLPMRGRDTPSPAEVASVAAREPFQSMSCLAACASSPRFCSIAWDRSVAWCSYTSSRRMLAELSFRGLRDALRGLPLAFCGASDPKAERNPA
jgi:MoaA/NifB/PqqE/SkfB family radical SAM enzyme